MKVLVTGHRGYIGAIMVPLLEEQGHTVRGVDVGYFDECSLNGAKPTAQPRVDVRDLGPEDLEGLDAVIHLAALSNDPLGALDPEWTSAINYGASASLAKAAREAGVRRFLLSSSCSVYGFTGDEVELSETAPLRPLTAYAVSKVRAEEALHALASPTFSPITLRPATAYGLSPRLRLDIVVNNLTAWACATGRVRLNSDGRAQRPLVHVRDICAAFLAALTAPREAVHDQCFNLGAAGENYSIRDVARQVAEVVRGAKVEVASPDSKDHRSYRVDFTKLSKTIPSFRPRWTVRQGAAELRDAIVATGLDRETAFGRRFIRLRQLEHLLEKKKLANGLRWAPESASTHGC